MKIDAYGDVCFYFCARGCGLFFGWFGFGLGGECETFKIPFFINFMQIYDWIGDGYFTELKSENKKSR